MFEAVFALCLLADPAACRRVLLPGYEAASAEACAALLAASPPSPAVPDGLSGGTPECRDQGEVAAFEEVADGVFAHRGIIADADAANGGDVSNAVFVIGEEAVAVIDTGGARQVGEAIFRAIRARTDLPVRHVILTHMHPDHVLGASVFADAGAEVIGHAGLARALADRAETYLTNFGERIGLPAFLGTTILPPDIAVEALMTLDLGGRVLDLRPWPPAHTGTDLTVVDRKTGTLIAGDLLFHEHTPALDGSLRGWQGVMEKLEGEPFERVVPGHGGPVLDWPGGATDLDRYLSVLAKDTREAIARGDTLGEAIRSVGQEEAGRWELFELFNARNATVAYTELEWE
ncbi:quinoprotein relay system zinc metallohydrolase 2 [Oceaniglobus roseus]|uniref:quinoprotein relay system zinc metallohydrolase 2 n=1 Tax=Oceaniglobus roseus TaxID=1737570 RepID=UPI000C7E9B17|nr:quinoprotein relay system zinc metallohydrolase 2 [Kandeliimicrobium roseum]